jgi:CheY-like chemotaxis protein
MINIHNMSVLIVDDVLSTCKLIRKLMQKCGYGQYFFFAHSGDEALDILHRMSINLIILDNKMPRMSGAEALSQIRENRNLRDLPVIMVSTDAFSDYIAEAGEVEVDAYIVKPITLKVIEEKIPLVVKKANNPSPIVRHLKKARDFDDEGEIDAAIKEVELAVWANPKLTRPVRELGYYYFKKNDLKEAEKWLLKATKMQGLDVHTFHYLGELYLKLNDIEKAAYYFEKAMRISPRHLNRGIKFGKTLVHMKKITEAIRVFDKTLELSGSTSELREEIADFCIEETVNEYAVKLLESLVQEKPDRADLFAKLGKALKRLNDIKRSVTYLIKADEIYKENLDIKIQIAKNYLTLEKPIFAENTLKEILKIDSKNEKAKELLKKCFN